VINDLNELIENRCKDIDYSVDDAVQSIAEKYGVCKKTVYNRFKTYFGDSPLNVVRSRMMPERQELESMILNTNNVDELWALLPHPYYYYKGIFDSVFGVSSYRAAKEKILMSIPTTLYNPTIRDNRSLIYSQLLGDGCYDAKRHALKIDHGIKQAEYLRFKVAIITKGYPGLKTDVRIRRHSQGHEYATWYSGRLGNIDIPDKSNYYTLVEKLTPLGWLLWWLDDGCWGQNAQICICNPQTERDAVEVLKTYGIKSRIQTANGCGSLIMCGKQNDIRFYKNFIEPFSHLIPACMQYKVKI